MEVIYCASNFAKLKGLLAKSTLNEEKYYVFAACKAIHTFGMRFAIDVIFCDKSGCILKYYRQLSPNRIVFVSKAFFAIEFVSQNPLDTEQLNKIVQICLAQNGHSKIQCKWI